MDNGWTDGQIDEQQMDNGACLYYKLALEPEGSGEITKGCLNYPNDLKYLDKQVWANSADPEGAV